MDCFAALAMTKSEVAMTMRRRWQAWCRSGARGLV